MPVFFCCPLAIRCFPVIIGIGFLSKRMAEIKKPLFCSLFLFDKTFRQNDE
jgi:hypothetical protein